MENTFWRWLACQSMYYFVCCIFFSGVFGVHLLVVCMKQQRWTLKYMHIYERTNKHTNRANVNGY